MQEQPIFLDSRKVPAAVITAWLFTVLAGAQTHLETPKGNRNSDIWVGTWATAPSGAANGKKEVGTTDQTFRQIEHISIGGKTARIRISNEFGTEPLVIGAAGIARSVGDGNIDASTVRTLTFGGTPTIKVPPGAFVISDPATIEISPLADMAVDLFVPAQPMREITLHAESLQKNYVVSGNQTGATSFTDAKPYTHWFFLKGIDVKTSASGAAIVTLGDSITDGHKSTENTNRRWPDGLAQRLQQNADTKDISVLNEGISGNRLLRDLGGPDALARFDRDVLGQSGVRFLVILEGINDIGHVNRPAFPGDTVTAGDLIFALSQLADRAHAHGIKVFGATLTPYPGNEPDAADIVALQKAENQWIRTAKELDGVIDFDSMTRDPSNAGMMLPADDSGDHLHPGDAGYKAMADGIDLKMFAR